MEEIVSMSMSMLPTVITGIFLFVFQRRAGRRETERDAHLEAQKKESMLQLQMLMANNKLSFAVAMAMKRGHPNGEVEDAIEEYEKAKSAYYLFLNEQAVEHLR